METRTCLGTEMRTKGEGKEMKKEEGTEVAK